MHSLANTEDEELFTQIVEKLCSLAALEEMEDTIDDLEKALEKSIYCIFLCCQGRNHGY